jgi:hypothetical protein
LTVVLPIVGLCLAIGLFATRLTARVWLLTLLGILAVLVANLPRG